MGWLLLALAWARLAQTQPAQHPFVEDHNVKPSLQANEPFIIWETFAFDINRNNYYDHLTIHENVSSILFPGGITGGVKLVGGDVDQPHSFVVLVRVTSSSKEALDFFSINSDTQTLFVNSTSSTRSPIPSVDDPIAVDIIVFVKQDVQQFGHTNIWTANLDIDIWPDLWFETWHMSLSALQGSITGIESLDFTAHEIIISTGNGSILGDWSLPASISLSTDNGDIDINLVPKQWSWGPSTGGDVVALAKTGDIAMRMPLERGRLSLRNGTTRIQAHKGSITGRFVHGAVTSLEAYDSINATILPYWAFHEWAGIQHNFITTDSWHGSTTVEVLPPIIDSYYKINPLFFAVCRHKQGSWVPPLSPVLRMKLTYPGEWGGTAVGHSGFGGVVYVSGEDFEELMRNLSTVKVQRRPVGSDLWFGADMGIAELHLNVLLD